MLLRSVLAFATLALLATLGCTRIRQPLTPPEEGGPPWREMVSKHIVLRTDRSEDEASEALADLEHMYAALHDIAFSQINVDGARVVVIHFERQRDYDKFAPSNTSGVFKDKLPNDLDSEPTMLVWGKLDIATRGTLQHELAHMFLSSTLGGAPPWLNEGLAEYYETLAVKDGFAYVGRPWMKLRAWPEMQWSVQRLNAYEISLVPIRLVPPVNTLVRMDGSKFYVWTDKGRQPTLDERRAQNLHLLGAYGLVHLIMHTPEYQTRFDEMMELVSKGLTVRQAWERAFSAVDSDQLETDYRKHLVNKYETMVLKTPYTEAPVKAEINRTMDPAEVHLLWARLREWGGADLPAAKLDIEAALRQAPQSAEVLFYGGLFRAAQGDLAGAEKAFHEALAAKPEEPRYLHGLVHVLLRLPDRDANAKVRAAVDKLAKVASSGRALQTIADYHNAAGRLDDALGFAQRSVKADPSCSSCFASLASTLFAKKRYSDAAGMQQVALSLLPDGAQDPDGEEKLRKYIDASLHGPADVALPPEAAPSSAPVAPSAAPSSAP